MITLQGKHTVAEVFSVAKLGKIFKQTFVTTSAINSGGLNGGFFSVAFVCNSHRRMCI